MNKIVQVPAQPMVNLPTSLAESQAESQRIHDVLILLESLTLREETTIKLIIDCLYDIGYVNMINQKVRWRSLNFLAKLIAKSSKPVFRIFAWRWFKQNCPQLITNWLYAQVTFGNQNRGG
jgi:hypothetical protein